MTPRVRPIAEADAPLLAQLHAASWRSAYRGLMSDAFLEHEVDAERQQAWAVKARMLSTGHFGFLATVDDGPAGFIFMSAAFDPSWGSMLDNLHVLEPFRSQGVGRVLIAAAMRELLARGYREPVWLWVFERNVAARRVYQRLGGREAERVVQRAFDGADRAKWRVVWDSPGALLQACGGPQPGLGGG